MAHQTSYPEAVFTLFQRIIGYAAFVNVMVPSAGFCDRMVSVGSGCFDGDTVCNGCLLEALLLSFDCFVGSISEACVGVDVGVGVAAGVTDGDGIGVIDVSGFSDTTGDAVGDGDAGVLVGVGFASDVCIGAAVGV